MNSFDRNSEKGQAIVYLVLGLVVFLGFVALAIDGGMAMSNRRHGQNAADAAALAGGAAAALQFEKYQDYYCEQEWSCTVVPDVENQAVSKAITRAGANGFTIEYDADLADHNGVKYTCPSDITDWYKAYVDVKVDISGDSPSNFLQLVYPDALHYDVEAVARARPNGPLLYGNAVVALNPSSCTGQLGVSFHGTGDVTIAGGGVFSNGCVRGDGAASVTVEAREDQDPNADTLVIEGNDLKGEAGDVFTPTAQTVSDQIPSYAYDIKAPDCTGHWVTDNDFPSDPDGLYCVTGNLTFKNGPYISGAHGVTIYMEDGDVTINGNEEVRIHAPSVAYNGSIPGILFYVPFSNHATLKFNGTSNVEMTGTVFAPGSNIQLTGTNDVVSFKSSQFIGWDVEVGGTQQTEIVYKGCDGYILPPSVELNK